MLHPHVSEEIKGFSKHLFATFLGLLMALGLEQWREHRVEVRLARESLAQVEQELREDLGAMQKERARAQTSAAAMKALQGFLAAAVENRKDAYPIQQLPANLKLEGVGLGMLQFRTDAWDNLKLVGAMRHLDAHTRSSLADTYNQINALPQKARMQYSSNHWEGFALLLRDPQRLTRMPREALVALQQNIELAEIMFDWADNELELALGKTQATQQFLAAAKGGGRG